MRLSSERDYRWYDYAIMGLSQCIQALQKMPSVSPVRPSPAKTITEANLTVREQKQSAGLMRVNHSGEVCAQALYLGQQLTSRTPTLRDLFQQAAQEEEDHLAWCAQRLTELNSHTSYLNPLWFGGAFFMGTAVGLISDRLNLSFLAETEKQVSAHLAQHLDILPANDEKSRAIVKQMQIDENKHASTALTHGGTDLPFLAQRIMHYTAKIMTNVAYYV